MKITEITDEQRSAMPGHVEQWIEYGLRTGTPTDAEDAAWLAGVRDVYRLFGWEWPGDHRVIRVASPMAVGVVGPVLSAGVRDGVWDGVSAGVRAGVRALPPEWMNAAESGYSLHLGGRLWCYWPAYTSFLRDQMGLHLDGDLWERDRAYAAAQSLGWWWPHKDYVVVCGFPTTLHVERDGTQYGRRLHCETGPAITYPDGWGLYAWHGRTVPEWVITDPTPERIAAEENVEIRRCAIEAYGWDRFAEMLGEPISTVPDPGNTPHTVTLYDVPEDIWGDPVRMILVTNGSAERDGTRRRYGVTVPALFEDPVDAAAWAASMKPEAYRRLALRT